jgi:hypothetical protein
MDVHDRAQPSRGASAPEVPDAASTAIGLIPHRAHRIGKSLTIVISSELNQAVGNRDARRHGQNVGFAINK